mmetsp:Transcript_549/g.1016  ORF Transcript_549/g.1016 Transcript_549/m.1016 type:complete len:202 (-) Transcript_549:1273-1878(-)
MSSPRRIQRRTTGRRSGAKNMCSVLHKPMPLAPNSRAFLASGPESAFAKTLSVSLTSSDHLSKVPKVPSRDGMVVLMATRMTSPVLPLIEMTCPSWNFSPVLLMMRVLFFSLISSSSQPTTQGLPHPRATTAACDVTPPRDVKIPCEAHIPPTSSGDVFSRTKMTSSPAAAISSAAVVVKQIFPTAAPGPPAKPTATTLSL